MKIRNVISIVKNHSEFAGYNWLNICFAPLFVFGMILFGYLAYISENGLLTVVIGVAILMLVILVIIRLLYRITLLVMRGHLHKAQEELLSYVFGSFIFNPEVRLDGVTFPNLNRHMIDVIIAHTSNNNIYFSPTISYTKQPLIKISLSEVNAVDINAVTIPRQTEQEISELDDAAATAAGSTGVYLPVGEIQKSLDKSLPMNRFRLQIMTSFDSYDFLLHEKTMGNQVIKKLTDMVVLDT